MAIYFPQKTGVMTTLPWRYEELFDTLRSQMPTGQQYARSRRSTPLGRWFLNLADIPDDLQAAITAFYKAMSGPLSEFSMLHPSGNLIPYSEDFSDASWVQGGSIADGGAQTDPFGGSLAQRLTGTTSNHSLTAEFLPDGDAMTVTAGDALWFCFSVWARAVSSGFDLEIAFVHGGGSSTRTWPLTTSWRRIWHAWQADTDNALSARIGGNSSWGAVSIDLFGAQVVPLPGPNLYSKTPGNAGLRAKCRFAESPFSMRTTGPQQNSGQVVVVEYA